MLFEITAVACLDDNVLACLCVCVCVCVCVRGLYVCMCKYMFVYIYIYIYIYMQNWRESDGIQLCVYVKVSFMHKLTYIYFPGSD